MNTSAGMNARRSGSMLSRSLLLLFAAALCAGFLALGIWQAGRGEQKAAALAAFEQALAMPQPMPLADALAAPGELPRRVAALLALRTDLPWLLLDNQRRGAQVGVIAYAVAEPGQDLPLLLVEFGWLPLPPDRSLPALPAPPATLALDGMLLAPPSPGLRLISHQFEGGAGPVLLTYLDLDEVAAWLDRPLHPQVLRPDPALALGFERDLLALPNTLSPEKHRGYALQWFGLAFAVLIVTAVLVFRSRRP
jgi:surfeit locus 1 family protein